ncbi:MAG: response regulator [Candidatus Adiutrix sp.]|nr:response regulator [Candidatus Adiutrix sp.]
MSIFVPNGTSLTTERIIYNAVTAAGGSCAIETRLSGQDSYKVLVGRSNSLAAGISEYTHTDDAERLARVDIPIGKVEYVAYMREADTRPLGSWDDLTNLSVGVSIDSNYVKSHFDSAVISPDTQSGFALLAGGTTDVFIATVYDDSTPFIPQGIVAAGVLDASETYCWYNRSQPEIGELLTRGLKAIQANGVLERIRARKSVEADSSKVIFLLSSYSAEMIWENQAEQSLRAAVDAHEHPVSLYIHNMNFRQTNFRPGQYEATSGYVRSTFMSAYPDVIIAMDNDALAFLQENYTRLFNGVPVVFCGVHGYTEPLISQYAPYATGISEFIDPTETVEFALNFNPAINRVYTVFDETSSASPVKAALLNVIEQKYGDRLAISSSGNQTFEEMAREVAGFDKNTMVLIGTYFSDKNGQFMAESEVAARLSAAASVPVYSLMSGYLGYGVVGGRVAYSRAFIVEAAHMATRILEGENPADIPIIGNIESEAAFNTFIVDKKAADRFGIPKSLYEGRAVILNDDQSIFEAYPAESALGIALLLIIIITSVLYILLLRAKRFRELAQMSADTEKESNRMKSDFLARMSHEIRTPLNAILGMDELILREKLSDHLRQYAMVILHSGRGLLSIINDILDFSKIEAGKMELVLAEYDVGSLVYDLVSMMRVRVSDKPIEVRMHISPAFPSHLYGDETRVRQVLLNFLTNAAKYTNEGSIALAADFEFDAEEKTGGMAVFAISDTGIGIKEEDIGKLFEVFTQVDTTTNRKVEGTGLGLAITKTLVDMMGGDISIQSQYGRGSVFTVRLRQEVHNYRPLANASEAFNKRLESESKSKEVRFVAPEGRILAVDDVDANLMVISGLLMPYKVQVDTVSSGMDAIEAVLQNDYDFVFMDHMMPGMDGVETTKKIRSLGLPRLKNLPIIALTANAVSGMREMLLQAGLSDFISKPIELDELDRILRKWIPKEKHQAPAEAAPAQAAGGLGGVYGIDVEKGLQRFGGDKTFYGKVLHEFAKSLSESGALLPQLYAEQNLEELCEQLHALKGVSGNVSCLEIYNLSIGLEAAVHASDFVYVQENFPILLDKVVAVGESIRKNLPVEKSA